MQRLTPEQLWSWVDRSAPELEAYLAEHPQDRAQVLELQGAMGGVRSAAEAPPTQIGPFRLGRRLGEGGMGVVFEAEQEHPARRVALKLLRSPGPPSPEAAERFRREADALARLNHPGIAVIYEAGTSGEGLPYLAMELVDGAPLDEHAQGAGLDQAQRLLLFRKVCAAVQNAHEHGVVHRDLKPQNILVTAEGEPKVLDFGLAQIAAPNTSQSLTQSGALVGTLAYMAPEQLSRGDGGAGPASDVYALGVVLYGLLLGELPLDLQDLPLTAAAQRIAQAPPIRPRSRQPSFPGDLEAVLLKALEKRPAARYSSAHALAQDLDRFTSGTPVLARRHTLRRRAAKFLGRHKLGSLVAGLSILAILLAGLTTWALNPHIVVDLYPGPIPKVSPFDAVRFEGMTPQVLHGDRWYELIEIGGTRANLLLEEIRQLAPYNWKKRFSEDIFFYLQRTGHHHWTDVDLVVRDLDTWSVRTLEDVPMTRASRQSTWTYRNKLLREALEFHKGEVRLWDRLSGALVVSIGPLNAQALYGYCDDNPKRFYPFAIELLTVHANYHAGDPIDIQVREPGQDLVSTIQLRSDSADLSAPIIPREALLMLFEAVRQP